MTFRAYFYRGTRPGIAGVANRLIRMRDHGPYSHMELCFSDGWSASSSLMDGGVRFRRIDYDPAKWDYIELPKELELGARMWFTYHQGQEYDWRADVCLAIGILAQSELAWMCSESCMVALGFDEKDAWRYSPNTAAATIRRITNNRT